MLLLKKNVEMHHLNKNTFLLQYVGVLQLQIENWRVYFVKVQLCELIVFS